MYVMDNIVRAALNPYRTEADRLDLHLHDPQGTPPPPGAKPAQEDQVEISPQARQMAEADPSGQKKDAEGLSQGEQKEVRELKERDQQVRAHEQAHLAASGGLARSGASFEYQTGPDGRRYAVGGEVNIDTGPVEDDPQATLRKAAHIRRAALAPADPSPQDRAVAAEAAAMAVKAQQELAQQNSSGSQSGGKTGGKINLFA